MSVATTRKGRGLGKKTIAMIKASAEILEEVQPTTVRGVCYQLFVRGQIPDMSVRQTKKISGYLTTAREKGMIPWAWIVDETREIEQGQSWSNPAAYADSVMRAYRKDWWADQPERILVVSEKGTIGGILRPVLQEYRVGFLILHGWSSATALHDLAEFSVEDDRPLTLLYVGDHDPSGRYMSDVDIPKRLDRYGGKAEVIRLATTMTQITTFDLPTFPARDKSKDSNYGWFLETHGTTCCELDAMNPNVLRDLVEGAITDRIDWERWHDAKAEELGERETIRENVRLLREMTWL